MSTDVVPRAVGRVLDLFETVLSDDGCTLTAAAGSVGLTPTTALRHLRALEARGYVRRDDDGRYHMGPIVQRLALLVGSDVGLAHLVRVAEPHLRALADRTGESVYLGVADVDDDMVTYVAAAESTRAIRHVGWVGQQVPREATAVGAALEHPGRVIERTGAVEPDITAVALGLPGARPRAIAVSVVGPAHRLGAETIGPVSAELEATARALAGDLGLEPDPSPRRGGHRS